MYKRRVKKKTETDNGADYEEYLEDEVFFNTFPGRSSSGVAARRIPTLSIVRLTASNNAVHPRA